MEELIDKPRIATRGATNRRDRRCPSSAREARPASYAAIPPQNKTSEVRQPPVRRSPAKAHKTKRPKREAPRPFSLTRSSAHFAGSAGFASPPSAGFASPAGASAAGASPAGAASPAGGVASAVGAAASGVASPPPQANARSATGIRAIFFDMWRILPCRAVTGVRSDHVTDARSTRSSSALGRKSEKNERCPGVWSRGRAKVGHFHPNEPKGVGFASMP